MRGEGKEEQRHVKGRKKNTFFLLTWAVSTQMRRLNLFSQSLGHTHTHTYTIMIVKSILRENQEPNGVTLAIPEA